MVVEELKSRWFGRHSVIYLGHLLWLLQMERLGHELYDVFKVVVGGTEVVQEIEILTLET